MGQAAAISLDRFRRRANARSNAAVDAAAQHPLVGAVIGIAERRFGLMTSHQPVVVESVVATSGDLAVADRLAFMAAYQNHQHVLVVEFDGWYIAVVPDQKLDNDAYQALISVDSEDSLRIMSIVSDQGIAPILGALSS